MRERAVANSEARRPTHGTVLAIGHLFRGRWQKKRTHFCVRILLAPFFFGRAQTEKAMRSQYELGADERAARKHLPSFPWAKLEKSINETSDQELRSLSNLMITCLGGLNEAAAAAGRELTDDESAAFSVGVNLVEFWKRQLGKPRSPIHKRDFYVENNEIIYGRRPGRGNSLDAEGETWQNRATGEKVRVYGSHEWLAEDSNRPDYSFGDLVRALLLPGAKTGIEAAALQESSMSTGGALVPSPLALRLLDALRAQSICIRLGMKTIPLTSKTLDIAKIETDPLPAWRDESASVSETDVSFSRLTFTAKSMSFLVRFSRELAEDANNLDSELRSLFGRVGAAEIDRVALAGVGTSSPSSYEPQGLLTMADVHETDCSGSPDPFTNFDALLDNLQAILESNAPPPTGLGMDPATLIKIAKFKDSTYRQLPWPADIADLPRLTSTALRSTASPSYGGNLVWGNWPDLYLGMRTELNVRPLVEKFSDKGEIGFWAWLRCDVQCAQPKAFGRLVNIA
jgi:HK97 family phage major capsid protein